MNEMRSTAEGAPSGRELPVKDADALGCLVADQISRQLPDAGSFTWTTRAAPA